MQGSAALNVFHAKQVHSLHLLGVGQTRACRVSQGHTLPLGGRRVKLAPLLGTRQQHHRHALQKLNTLTLAPMELWTSDHLPLSSRHDICSHSSEGLTRSDAVLAVLETAMIFRLIC